MECHVGVRRATPQDSGGDDLATTIDRATADVAAMYVDRAKASEAELQFAIYPWAGEPGSVILDIRAGAEGYTAHDIVDSGTIVQGDSLDALVRDAERVLTDPGVAMFRWIRPMLSVVRD